MTNSIRKIKQDLRAYAKRCKDVHYTEGLLITFLVTGTLFVAVICSRLQQIQVLQVKNRQFLHRLRQYISKLKQQGKKTTNY